LGVKELLAPGRWLSHYTRAAAAFEGILPSRRLLMRRYGRMRDPFENKDPIALTFSGFTDGGQSFEATFGDAVAGIKRIRDGMRILSFTMDEPEWGSPFGCGWARPRMWEQYADNHSGVCLVFDREVLAATIVSQFDPGPYHRPVLYSPEGFSGSDARHLRLDSFPVGTPSTQSVNQYVEAHHEEFFFLKTQDWSTEFEYRFVLTAPDDVCGDLPVDYGDALAAVVVGEHFPNWQMAGAKELCDSAGVALRQVSWDALLGRPYPVDPLAAP
jgi:hypothetical protein